MSMSHLANSSASLPPVPSGSPPPPSPQPLALSDQQYLVSDNQVLVSVYVNAIWGGLCVFGFVVLRGWVRGPGGVFQRRQELQDLFMRPPKLVLGTIRQIWNWVVPLLAVSDAEIVCCSGFDALVLTRVLLIGLQMFTVMTLFGMTILIPVYYTLGGVESSSASLGTLARLSVANIPTGSSLFVLPFCMTYIFIGYGCWVMLINCKCYAQLRMAYFCCLDALPSTLQPEVANSTTAEPEADNATLEAVTATASGAGGFPASGAFPGCSSSSSSSKSLSQHERVRAPGNVVLELSTFRGNVQERSTASAGLEGGIARPVAEGTEWVNEDAVAEERRTQDSRTESDAAGDGDSGLDRTPITRLRASCRTPALGLKPRACAEAAEVEDGGGSIEIPAMSLKSTWLNMANFFNPTVRMMLDYLDWQNPLQRTAARFGVRGLQLPTVVDDEVPPDARLYGKDEPLVSYDDMVTKSLRSQTAVPPTKSTSREHGSDGEVGEQTSAETGSAHGFGSVASGSGLPAPAAAVLPYWRPLEALHLMRKAGSPGTGSACDGVQLMRSSESATHLQAAAATPVCAPSGDRTVDAVAGSRSAGAGSHVSVSLLARAFGSQRYRLRHSQNDKGPCSEGSAAMVEDSKRAGGPVGAAAAQFYGMADPRQPLLPGKRNVRLLQLLQVPIRLHAADASGRGGCSGGGSSGPRAYLRCATIRHGSCSGIDVVTVNDDPIRLVNANHYVVLIKRVHLKRGPDLIDMLAAMSYTVVSRLRTAAMWASESAAEHVAAGISVKTFSTRKNRRRAATASAVARPIVGPANAPPTGSSGIQVAPSIGSGAPSQPPRNPRDVEAQAVAVATSAAEPPLRGIDKIKHEVARYFEMFRDPGNRRFDPLKDVRAVDTRGKSMRASRGTSATGGDGGGGRLIGSGPDGSGAFAAKVMISAATTATRGLVGRNAATELADTVTATTTAFTATDADAVAAAEKAMADASLDPNGAAVAAVLRDLFPKTFRGLIPVTNHDSVDKLIYQWDAKMLELASVVRELERLEAWQRRQLLHSSIQHGQQIAMEEGEGSGAVGPGPAAGVAAVGKDRSGGLFPSCKGCSDCCGAVGLAAASLQVKKLQDQVAKLKIEVRKLEGHIDTERARALQKPIGTAYFAMFSNSQDAQMLGQCRRVVPPQGPGTLLTFDAVPAPSPEDISWPALWSTGSLEQMLRRAAIVIPMAVIFILPIGPLQGALASLDLSLCGGTSTFEGITTNKLYVDWFCEPKNLGVKLWKSLLTGVLPSVLGLLWTALIMPQFLYLCSSISRSELSLSGQERQMQGWFFWYSLINTFLGAVLGSGVFSQLGAYLADPRKLLDKIGRALPSTANFFVQFCIARALFTNFVRLLWPHAGSMLAAIFRSVLRLGLPRSLHASALAHMPPSTRAISYYNAILQVFMFGCAFAVVAPIILPCCWLFFLTGFFAYRYSILYVYERNYESGGRMWSVLFDQVMGFMILMEIFSGAVFIVNRAWVFAIVTWCTLTPPLLIFWRYCSKHYIEPVNFPPLSVVASEPRGVRLSPLTYMPPALRPGALGWYPEQGKVWEKYGIPKHW